MSSKNLKNSSSVRVVSSKDAARFLASFLSRKYSKSVKCLGDRLLLSFRVVDVEFEAFFGFGDVGIYDALIYVEE
jgi:hypothetical protein